MNWNEAKQIMLSGGVVESQVSFTCFEMKGGNIFAEGTKVDEEYVTSMEKEGEWKQTEYLCARSKEDIAAIPDEKISELLDKTCKKAVFDMNCRP